MKSWSKKLFIQTESEFNEFEARLKSAKSQVEGRLKSWNIEYYFKTDHIFKFFKFGLWYLNCFLQTEIFFHLIFKLLPHKGVNIPIAYSHVYCNSFYLKYVFCSIYLEVYI